MKRERSAEIDPHVFDDSTGLENMRQLIQLRWIAVVGQIATIAVVNFVFAIHLPLQQMSVVLVCLVAFNIASMLRWRAHHEVTNGEVFFALLVDVTTLTAQLYLSGGATNPFSFLSTKDKSSIPIRRRLIASSRSKSKNSPSPAVYT